MSKIKDIQGNTTKYLEDQRSMKNTIIQLKKLYREREEEMKQDHILPFIDSGNKKLNFVIEESPSE